MSGRIVIAGRVYLGARPIEAGDILASYPRVPGPDGQESAVVGVLAYPPNHPHAPWREGIPWRDAEEDVVYRIVDDATFQMLDWQSSAFWMQRWNVKPATFLSFCQRGWVDAAMARGSACKRYRCRDERVVMAHVEELRRQRDAKTAARKLADEKRAARKMRAEKR